MVREMKNEGFAPRRRNEEASSPPCFSSKRGHEDVGKVKDVRLTIFQFAVQADLKNREGAKV
jgi:hypothetical protein